MKYEVEQASMTSPSFMVFCYYLEGDVDVADYATANASFNAEIKMLQSHCILFEGAFFKPMKVKGDGSSLYQAIASQVMSFFLMMFGLINFPLEQSLKKTSNI